MPCNCDHLEPSGREVKSRELMRLLVEAGLWEGEVPYYGQVENLERHTQMMCDFCSRSDVTQQSLEMQIWWRDHQAADKVRLEREQQSAKTEVEKRAALDKLTPYERKLLGL